jgi:flagellar hook-associated protein FlgK
MSSLPAIAMSGMQVAQRQLAASAHNLANAGTEGFERQVVTPQALPGGGVTSRNSRGPAEAGLQIEDLIQQRTALYSAQASAVVLRIAGQLTGTLLDERA